MEGSLKGEPSCSAAKIAKLTENKVDDEVTQRRNLELLKSYKIGSISGKTFSALVDETFQARRTFIQVEANSCKEILDMCPYLGKVENVSLAHVFSHTNRVFCRKTK